METPTFIDIRNNVYDMHWLRNNYHIVKNEIPSLVEDNSGTYASTGKMETNNKPDFEKMAREYAETFKTGEWFENIRTDAGKVIGEKIWNDYVIVERNQHQIELSNYAYQIGVAKRERDKAESENQALKSKLDKAEHMLNEIDRSLYVGPDLKDKEIMMHYIGVTSVIKEEIQDFLKDKI